MIDEARTLEIYGYTSDELSPKSAKPIVAVCEECGKYRDTTKHALRELCKSCSVKKFYEDPAEREKSSIRMKMIRDKLSAYTKKYYEDPIAREKASARAQGIEYEDWTGFSMRGRYCPKFNSDIKQYIRDKYNNCDYISGVHKDVCNNGRNLDVHHVDYNKQQGCDDHGWRLVPLSQKNHVRTNANRSFWNRLFTYALQYDETYYEDAPLMRKLFIG